MKEYTLTVTQSYLKHYFCDYKNFNFFFLGDYFFEQVFMDVLP